MTNTMSRRNFLKWASVATAAGIYSTKASAVTVKNVVVIGGGFAGATAAKYLKLWGGSSVNVTLVEPNAQYASPILSNLILNGQKTESDLYFNYSTLTGRGVTHVQAVVTSYDSTNRFVNLSNGSTLSYDRLIVAPGIDFEFVNEYDVAKVPHAWKGGNQLTVLKNQLDALTNGENFVMTIPPAPFRCPPGPYERACVVADYLRNVRGFTGSSVIVLDANSDVLVEPEMFKAEFSRLGVDYRANQTVTAVNDSSPSVTTNSATVTAGVLNVIPPMKAGQLVANLGLNNSTDGKWAQVNPQTFESTAVSGVYVIGDAQAVSDLPKAGHIANSEAKVCVDAVLRSLSGITAYAQPVVNSACYSPTSTTTASWLTAIYRFNGTQYVVAETGQSGTATTANYREMWGWVNNLFGDTFA